MAPADDRDLNRVEARGGQVHDAGGGPMTEHRAGRAVQERRAFQREGRLGPMADQVDTREPRVQRTAPHAAVDDGPAEPGSQHLRPRDVAASGDAPSAAITASTSCDCRYTTVKCTKPRVSPRRGVYQR